MGDERKPLDVRFEGGRLVISIGAETLAGAFNESGMAKPYDMAKAAWVPAFRVCDPATFTQEVARELQREREDGWTLVHGLLDEACEKAVEDGAQGVQNLRARCIQITGSGARCTKPAHVLAGAAGGQLCSFEVLP